MSFPLSVTNGLVSCFPGDKPDEMFGNTTVPIEGTTYSYFGVQDLLGTGFVHYPGFRAYSTVNVPLPLTLTVWLNTDIPYDRVIGVSAPHLAIATVEVSCRIDYFRSGGMNYLRLYHKNGVTAQTGWCGWDGFVQKGWHHVSAVFSSSTLRSLYIDGQFVASNSTTVSENVNFTRFSPRATWQANSGVFSQSPEASVANSLDHRLYNRALTVPEIKQLYIDGRVMFRYPARGYTNWSTEPFSHSPRTYVFMQQIWSR